jgi:hypothetical protein
MPIKKDLLQSLINTVNFVVYGAGRSKQEEQPSFEVTYGTNATLWPIVTPMPGFYTCNMGCGLILQY